MNLLSFNLKEELNCILSNDFNKKSKITVSQLSDAVFSVSKNLKGNLSIVLEKNNFKKYKSVIEKSLSSYKDDKNYFIVEDTESNFNLNFKNSVVLVIGGENLIIKSVNLANKYKIDCYAFLTESNVDYLFCDIAKTYNLGLPFFVDMKNLKKIFIDLDILVGQNDDLFSISYIKSISNILTLIDYKIRILLSNKESDKKNYNLVKEIINKALTFTKYSSKKEVLIYCDLLNAIIKANSDILLDSGVELFKDALKIFCPDIKEGERYFISYIKLGNLYHFYFNNDFSSYLLSCDYNKDVEELSKNTKISPNYFKNKLKVPSIKRQKLIKELKIKISKAFLSETATAIKIQNLVRKTYFAISNKNKEYILKKEQVKKALKFCTYFSDKVSLLTLIRDEGILNL